jgi:hypothetical protein
MTYTVDEYKDHQEWTFTIDRDELPTPRIEVDRRRVKAISDPEARSVEATAFQDAVRVAWREFDRSR